MVQCANGDAVLDDCSFASLVPLDLGCVHRKGGIAPKGVADEMKREPTDGVLEVVGLQHNPTKSRVTRDLARLSNLQ